MERHHTATAYVVSKGHTLLLWHNFLKMWLPPGGHSEVNEHPVETAIREAQEETALTVKIITQNPILISDNPQTIEAPRVILLENIDRKDQPPHQHIDHVYFSVPTSDVAFEKP
ncbi:MAG: NUDIX domain-containing protein, partial [Tepidiformaceae bacterium]